MTAADKIYQHLAILPEPLQIEVLDFVESLVQKVTSNKQKSKDELDVIAWSKVSLAMAMRGMEDDEDEPTYTIADLNNGTRRTNHPVSISSNEPFEW